MMQAIILAGGKGTRLKPFTVSFPKPLVPLGDVPILEVIVQQLVQSGIKDIVISTGHLAHLIQAYFGDGTRFGAAIRYVQEERPLNTAGALKLITGLAPEFLVMNGDILTSLDFKALIETHKRMGATGTLAMTTRESKIDFGVVSADKDGYLDAWSEKPSYTFNVSMGIYVLSREAVSVIADGEAIGMPDLLQRLKSQGRKVYCHNSDAYWLDIGRIDDYERAQAEFAQMRPKLLKS